jgi:hypothetical protein
LFYIGIDNGLHGAIAVISDKKEIKMLENYTKDLNRLNKIVDTAWSFGYIKGAVIEKPIIPVLAGGKYSSSGTSTFNTFGHWEALLQINSIKYTCANPAIRHKDCWRKEFKFKSIKSADLKQESIKKCLELFPESENLIKKEKPVKGKNGRKQLLTDLYDDNKAESILLAEYCRRLHEKEIKNKELREK